MAEEEKEQEEVQEKGGKKNLFLLIAIGAIMLVLIVTVVVVVLVMGGEDDVTSSTQNAKKTTKEISQAKLGPIVALDQFIVNLADSAGRRYLKTKIQLELSGSELAEEVENKTPLIRDAIIRTLSSKTYEEVSTQSGKARLKEEILGNINRNLIDGEVRGIFFTDFVVQ